MSVTPAELLKTTQDARATIAQKTETTRSADIDAFWKKHEPLMKKEAANGSGFLRIIETVPSKHDVAKDARDRGFKVDMPGYYDHDDGEDYFTISWEAPKEGNKKARKE